MPPTAPGELIDAGTPATPDAAAELIESGTPATPVAAGDLVAGYQPAGMSISGTLSPNATGAVREAGLVEGRMSYSTDGSTGDPPASGRHVVVGWVGGEASEWSISVYIDEEFQIGGWISTDDVATPDLVTTWTAAGGATGTPVVTPTGAAAPGELVDGGTPATPAAPGSLV